MAVQEACEHLGDWVRFLRTSRDVYIKSKGVVFATGMSAERTITPHVWAK